MESFAEETRPLLAEPKQNKHLFFKLLQIFLTVAVIVLLVVILQESLRVRRVDEGAQNVLQAAGPALPAAVANSEANPIVEISSGKVSGKILKSRLGRPFNAFYNIPYAEAPVGELRFQPPRPYTAKWEEVLDGSVRGNAQTECLQFKGEEVSGVEDCLKLSVFTPKLPAPESANPELPVMVYLLGGAFIFGRSNRYGAEYVMDEDVVLVFVDFRVGAFGHLNTEDEEIRGNMAFKDQVMSLKWVQENIARFGGNPKRVVLFGNSSGASSIHALILSNMSKGLFHGGISQSGSVLLDPGKRTRPITTAKILGRLLKCPEVQNTTLLHNCFKEADPKRLATMYALLPDTHVITKEVIPRNGDKSDVFLEDMPAILLQQGKFNKDIPWLLGSNSAESFFTALDMLKDDVKVKGLNSFWDFGAPILFNFKDYKDHNASHALKNFYFHGEDISNKTRYELTNCLSDIVWVHPVTKAASLHAKFGGKAYFYWITHEPVQSYGEHSKRGYAAPYGVAHADEVQFLFPFEPFPLIDERSDDFVFSTAMIKIWTEFARTGVPKVPGGEVWPPLDAKKPLETPWMELNGRHYQLVRPLKERIEFLNSFPLLDPNYEYVDEVASS